MIALAFDLANHSAYAKVQIRPNKGPNDPEFQVLDAGVIIVPAEVALGERLEYLRINVQEVLREAGQIDFIIFEQVPVAYKGAGQVALQQQQYGVFLSVVGGVGVPIMTVTPNVWQRSMLPYIPGRKAMTRYKVRQLLKAGSIRQARLRAGCETEDDNVADACLIGIWGIRQRAMSGLAVRP